MRAPRASSLRRGRVCFMVAARSGGMPGGLAMPRGSPIRGGASCGHNLPADLAPAHGHAAVRAVVASCRPGAPCTAHRAGSDAGVSPARRQAHRFTGAVRIAALRPQTQGTRLSAAQPPETAGSDAAGRDSRRRARSARVLTGAAGPAASVSRPTMASFSPGLRSGPPLPPDACPAPRERGRAAHRSSGPNDETHVDRCHPRGRNPRGGVGR
jgi:hypothetical protein